MHSSCTCACSLDENKLGPEGGAALAAILSQTKITNLKCTMTSNPDSSICFPVNALNMHCSCTNPCRLGGNELGPEGGAALAEGLKGNSTLISLE